MSDTTIVVLNLDRSWNFARLSHFHGLDLFPSQRRVELIDLTDSQSSEKLEEKVLDFFPRREEHLSVVLEGLARRIEALENDADQMAVVYCVPWACIRRFKGMAVADGPEDEELPAYLREDAEEIAARRRRTVVAEPATLGDAWDDIDVPSPGYLEPAAPATARAPQGLPDGLDPLTAEFLASLRGFDGRLRGAPRTVWHCLFTEVPKGTEVGPSLARFLSAFEAETAERMTAFVANTVGRETGTDRYRYLRTVMDILRDDPHSDEPDATEAWLSVRRGEGGQRVPQIYNLMGLRLKTTVSEGLRFGISETFDGDEIRLGARDEPDEPQTVFQDLLSELDQKYHLKRSQNEAALKTETGHDRLGESEDAARGFADLQSDLAAPPSASGESVARWRDAMEQKAVAHLEARFAQLREAIKQRLTEGRALDRKLRSLSANLRPGASEAWTDGAQKLFDAMRARAAEQAATAARHRRQTDRLVLEEGDGAGTGARLSRIREMIEFNAASGAYAAALENRTRLRDLLVVWVLGVVLTTSLLLYATVYHELMALDPAAGRLSPVSAAWNSTFNGTFDDYDWLLPVWRAGFALTAVIWVAGFLALLIGYRISTATVKRSATHLKTTGRTLSDRLGEVGRAFEVYRMSAYLAGHYALIANRLCPYIRERFAQDTFRQLISDVPDRSVADADVAGEFRKQFFDKSSSTAFSYARLRQALADTIEASTEQRGGPGRLRITDGGADRLSRTAFASLLSRGDIDMQVEVLEQRVASGDGAAMTAAMARGAAILAAVLLLAIAVLFLIGFAAGSLAILALFVVLVCYAQRSFADPIRHVWSAVLFLALVLALAFAFPVRDLANALAEGLFWVADGLDALLAPWFETNLALGLEAFLMWPIDGMGNGAAVFVLFAMQTALALLYLFAGTAITAVWNLLRRAMGKRDAPSLDERYAAILLALAKPGFRGMFLAAAFATALVVAVYLGLLMNDLAPAWLRVPAEVRTVALSVLWIGPLVFFIEMYKAGKVTSALLDDDARQDAAAVKLGTLEWLEHDLMSESPAGTLIGYGRVLRDPKQETVHTGDGVADTGGWRAEIAAELSTAGYAVLPELDRSLAEIEKALDLADKSGQPEPQKEGSAVLIQETLTEQKLLILSAMVRFFRDRGRAVLVLADQTRIGHIAHRLQDAEATISTAVASSWHRLAALGNKPANDCILYGAPEEIDERMFQTEEGDRLGHQLTEALDRLGAVFVLEAHAIDMAQLQIKLQLLRSSLGGSTFEETFVLVQSEPMDALQESLRNGSLHGHRWPEISLSPKGDTTSRMVIVDYATDRETAYGAETGAPMVAWHLARVERHGHGITLLDEPELELKNSWLRLWDRIPGSERRTPPQDKPPLAFEAIPQDRDAPFGPHVFIERDDGNLATCLMRDLASPRLGQNAEPVAIDALNIVLSEPSPYRDFMLSALGAGGSAGGDLSAQMFDSYAVRRFLPRAPDLAEGPGEVLRMLLFRFLAARKQELTEDEIKEVLRNKKLVLEDHTTGRQQDFIIGTNAVDLTDAFKRVFGADVPFEDRPPEHYRRMVRATSIRELQAIVHQGQLGVPIGAADSLRQQYFSVADEGLVFSTGTRLVMERQAYVFDKIGPDRYRLKAATDDATMFIDDVPRDAFSKTYHLCSIELSERQISLLPRRSSGMVFFRADRASHMHYRLNLLDPAQVEDKGKASHRRDNWFCQTMAFRFAVEEAEAEDTARALCLTLQHLLRKKFPNVAPRVSVVSPQANPPAGASARLLAEIAAVEIGEATHEALRTSLRFTSEDHGDRLMSIELLVIEDADHSLGVASSLKYSEGEGGILKLWEDFLSYCANASEDPFAYLAGRDDAPDYAAAYRALRT